MPSQFPPEPAELATRTESPFVSRPVSRLRDVTTDLLDFAIVTYAVEPEALARHLPPGFEPETFTLGDGRRAAFVSAVPFRDKNFRFGFAPFFRSTMGQTNYRAYIRHRGARAVWFFGTSLDSPWVWIPRLVWKLLWHPARMRFESVARAPSASARHRPQGPVPGLREPRTDDARGCSALRAGAAQHGVPHLPAAEAAERTLGAHAPLGPATVTPGCGRRAARPRPAPDRPRA